MEKLLKENRDGITSAITRAMFTILGWGVPETDVRLQVVDGYVRVHTGDPSFDQDHRGCWGAGLITWETDADELADDLIEQVLDHAAQLS